MAMSFESLAKTLNNYLTRLSISKESLLLTYGTSGYRCEAFLLKGIATKKGKAIGVMVTASHNPPSDNGLKVIDSDGGMLPPEVETGLVEFVKIPPSELTSWMKRHLPQDLDLTVSPRVFVGCDTRATSAELAEEVCQAAQASGAVCTNYGLVTTPQLHLYVQRQVGYHLSSSFHLLVCEVAYTAEMAQRFAAALALLRGGTHHLNVDCAHGVGGIAVASLAAYLHLELIKPNYPADSPRVCLHTYNTLTHDKPLLNNKCGADFVKLYGLRPQLTPSQDNSLAFTGPSNERWASIDGDADRLIYFYPVQGSAEHVELIDGDRIAVLFASFIIRELKRQTPVPSLRLGVVQTAYSNAAATAYLQRDLGVEVTYAKTGVKYLHKAAKTFDFGIYFEANGHGTVLLSAAAKQFLTSLPSDNLLSVFFSLVNTAVGDALSDLLLVEFVLAARQLSLRDWRAMYEVLPSRQLKVAVADRYVIKVSENEFRTVKPEGVQVRCSTLVFFFLFFYQAAIDTLVTKVDSVAGRTSSSRAFIRPSGTEDTVRVYAESTTQALADWLAHSVARLVHSTLGGCGPMPADPGALPTPTLVPPASA
ncbi:unnamed protein product [Schistocephalus solidus]|uniref:Phosphoacetylglucosamine mutase n=1 Tax=Schistocephalus solidus TaxID=70667 RepID=A0A183SVE4_SCHSO|nr:unnamed protein product [Schistocephalus solidus]